MDQNENKNMESVAEKATEVKDEVVEAAEKTAGEVKEAAETVVEDVKEAKAPEADGDFKEVVENVKEHAEEAGERAKEVAGAAKEKVEEVASKVFTEENKAKINEATEKAVDKVESYNKNNLFEKIFFGVSIALALFTLLVLLNGLGFAFGSNGGVNTTSLQAAYMDLSNKVKNLSLYFGLSFFFALVGAVFTGYFLFQARKENKNLWTNVNVASLAMVGSVFLGNILGGGFLDALGKLSDFFSGKSNSAVSALISEAFANPLAASRNAQSFVDGLQTGSKIAIFFYLVAFAASAATVYFYYQKLFQKKVQ
ncbi:OST5 family protein [Streptococcus sp. 263_SSPC]|uniref:OST5 family protein n=1 Tax=Streptococcus sp. 263_SSPC TaxID=1579343 RepID=UPI00066149EE|nr:OST5 family protein [Streptococcus sp. 263_SSPC]